MVLMTLFSTEEIFNKMQEIQSIKIFAAFIPVYLVVGIVSFVIYMRKDRESSSK